MTNLPPLYIFSNVMPNEQHVHNLFSQFGEIERMRVVRDRVTNTPVGIAMVLFKTPEAAQRAIMTINSSGIGAVASMWLPKAVLDGTQDLAVAPSAAIAEEEGSSHTGVALAPTPDSPAQ